MLWWSGPTAQIPAPGPDASPESVVRTYIDAINARDFDTANEIDARPDSDLGRSSRPMRVTGLADLTTRADTGGRVSVVFEARLSNTDGSIQEGRQSWGYVLERGDDGQWHIVDAGVA